MISLLKKLNLNTTNYRPISLLFNISKGFERLIYNQINEYIKPFLSKVLTGFRENHNTHHSLLKMLENFKEALGKGNSVSTTFMGHPKGLITYIITYSLLNLKLTVFQLSLFPTYTAI